MLRVIVAATSFIIIVIIVNKLAILLQIEQPHQVATPPRFILLQIYPPIKLTAWTKKKDAGHFYRIQISQQHANAI